MQTLATYAKFYTQEETIPLTDLLKQQNIPFVIETERNQLDKIYIGETLDPMVTLKIPQQLFQKVNELIDSQTAKNLIEPDSNYYLYSFSDEELLDVIQHPNEWSSYDRVLARKFLVDRNVAIPDLQQSITSESYVPERLKKNWIIGGYIFSILFSFVGIFWGLSVLTSTKTLKDGRRVKIYDDYSRDHARVVLIIGIIMMSFFLWRGVGWMFYYFIF